MKDFKILIPLFNDWKSVTRLLHEIDLQVVKWNTNVSVIIVNDASTEKKTNLNLKLNKIQSVKIINMKKNMSHQRCIATGLKYISVNENFERVIVMDADGEDRPEELNAFLKKSLENPKKAITGNRIKRSEGIFFRTLYQLHKLLTLIFTGKMIKFGNFSCITKEHVHQLIKQPHLWNSFSGSVVKILEDRTSIPSIRGNRYILPSKMNLVGLIFHSFTIISVFKETVIARSIIFSIVYFFLIFNSISILIFFPIIFLLIFSLIILKASLRSNMNQLEKSLDNISSIDILANSNSR